MADKKAKILGFIGALITLSGAIPLLTGLLAGTITFPHIIFRLVLCGIGYALIQYAQRTKDETT